MKCEECENRLLTEGANAPDMQAHLSTCAACRKFAAALELSLGRIPAAPSPELDAKVIGLAHIEHAAIRRRSRLRLILRSAVLPAAAALVLGLFLAKTYFFHAPASSPTLAMATSQQNLENDDMARWSLALDMAELELETLEEDLETDYDSAADVPSGNAAASSDDWTFVPLSPALQNFSEQLFSLECDIENLYSFDF